MRLKCKLETIYLTIGKPLSKEKLKFFHPSRRKGVSKMTYQGMTIVDVPDHITKDKKEFENFILGKIGSNNFVIIRKFQRKRNKNGRMQPVSYKVARLHYKQDGVTVWEYDTLTSQGWFTNEPKKTKKLGYSVVSE